MCGAPNMNTVNRRNEFTQGTKCR